MDGEVTIAFRIGRCACHQREEQGGDLGCRVGQDGKIVESEVAMIEVE